MEEEVHHRVSPPPKDDLDPITQDEISKHIKALKIRKAPGIDSISSKIRSRIPPSHYDLKGRQSSALPAPSGVPFEVSVRTVNFTWPPMPSSFERLKSSLFPQEERAQEALF
ncbi:hypothetical protein EVAR_7740_1 [Eumeta japonica]|uniref:Uncharacterized protein n=1 Tax=Eumeta variegata TaxID=151549 RepID=A0A4C1TLZ0_EUMVA|nr:hypothetical protein EVAR_7740_1 [Eumeta japonica]